MTRDRWTWLTLALGFAVFLVYAWPGYMSIDSAAQLVEARARHHTDWHPPIMASLWHILDWIVRGPILMLLAQSLAFVAGLYRLLRRTFTPRRAAAITVAVFLFPPVLAPMAVIWKDSQMAGYLLLGLSLLYAERRWWRVVGVALITLACAMRYNAPAATLPLFLFAFEWRTGQRWLIRTAFACAVWIASTGTAIAVDKVLTDEHSYTWHAAIAPYDIAGTLAHSHAYKDSVLNEILQGTPVQIHDHIALTARRLYSPVTWWQITNGPGRMFDWPENAAHREALERAWKKLVFDNPGAYLRHRFAVFRQVLGLTSDKLFAAVWYGVPSDDYRKALNIDGTPSALQTTMGDGILWLADHSPIFRPYVYFFIALLLLPMARRHRDLLGLLVSGLLYELTFIPFGAPDVRYSHWMTVTTIIAAVLLFHRRRERGERDVLPHRSN